MRVPLTGLLVVQGGGWCYTREECLERSATPLGSSHLFPLQIPGTGMLSTDPTANPDFHNWNVAYLAYCDGASFAGDVATPVTVAGQKLYFRGRRIRDAIVEELLRKRGLSDASQVLVGGCSAGGLAAFLHCDHMRTQLLPRGAHVKCFSDAGMFLDVPDVAGNYTIRARFREVFAMQNVSGGSNAACIRSKPPELQYQCFFGQYTLPFIRTPFFVLNSNYDIWSLFNILSPPEAGALAVAMDLCLSNMRLCSQQQLAQLQGFRNAMVEAVNPIFDLTDGGALLFSCMYEHCTSFLLTRWLALTVHGLALKQAMGDWFFERGLRPKTTVDCPYPCNNCAFSELDFLLGRTLPSTWRSGN